jgi:hypothetical protein
MPALNGAASGVVISGGIKGSARTGWQHTVTTLTGFIGSLIALIGVFVVQRLRCYLV